MRIVLFIGSPIFSEKEQLVAVGKKLRKCNVAVDVVGPGMFFFCRIIDTHFEPSFIELDGIP